MASHSPDNQTSSLTDTDNDVEAVDQNNGERLSLQEIADLSGIDPKIVRKYLYRGIIGSTKKSDVLAWLDHRVTGNVFSRQPRVEHRRVFNKWRR